MQIVEINPIKLSINQYINIEKTIKNYESIGYAQGGLLFECTEELLTEDQLFQNEFVVDNVQNNIFSYLYAGCHKLINNSITSETISTFKDSKYISESEYWSTLSVAKTIYGAGINSKGLKLKGNEVLKQLGKKLRKLLDEEVEGITSSWFYVGSTSSTFAWVRTKIYKKLSFAFLINFCIKAY